MFVLLKEQKSDPSPSQPDEDPDTSENVRAGRSILYAACDATITSLRHRITIQNKHEHRFMNPGGFLFLFGCFAEAIGCTIVGPGSSEYAWFPGYTWRFALCGACGQHLGWHFRKDGQEAFFGLILDRLRQPMQDD
jgi:hypothetical protein